MQLLLYERSTCNERQKSRLYLKLALDLSLLEAGRVLICHAELPAGEELVAVVDILSMTQLQIGLIVGMSHPVSRYM